jgi:hypothetical protein
MYPSEELYKSLHFAFNHFNQELFRGKLPDVIFTVQRQVDVVGYFAAERWVSPTGKRRHEIAINPVHMGQSRVIEVMQTLVHEMVHCWQYCYGKPGRASYHNKEWANKMRTIGLHPSSTGKPGGKQTGQVMSDYPVEGGEFMQSCHRLVTQENFRLPWIYRLSLPEGIKLEPVAPLEFSEEEPVTHHLMDSEPETFDPPLEVMPSDISPLDPDVYLFNTYQDLLPAGSFYSPPKTSAKRKTKYECPSCFTRVWGKPGIHLVCGDCEVNFEELD